MSWFWNQFFASFFFAQNFSVQWMSLLIVRLPHRKNRAYFSWIRFFLFAFFPHTQTKLLTASIFFIHIYIFFIFSIRSHFTSLHFDSNRLLMRFFFNWKRLCSLFLLLLPLYFCWLPYFVNGFFCIVNWMAEASLEVMTSFMHLDNNYFCLKDRHLHVRAL